VKDQLVKCLKKGGYSFTGEALNLNTYPFYFEEWIAELLEKAKWIPGSAFVHLRDTTADRQARNDKG